MLDGRPDWLRSGGTVERGTITSAQIAADTITAGTTAAMRAEPWRITDDEATMSRRRLKRLATRHTTAAVRAAGGVIIGYDLSRYDELHAGDSAAFVILNVDDPQYAYKLRRAAAQGKPWGGYKWIYPNASGRAAAQECASKLRGLGIGEPPLGSWADYEEAGNTQGQLVEWFEGLDAVGARGGYYTNDWRVDHAALIRTVGMRWYWMAAYPGANDGTFPGFGAMRASRPVQLWQFTSTSGTRDQNAVVDLAWYESLGASSGGGGLFKMLSEDEERRILNFADTMMEGGFGLPKLLPAVAEIQRNVSSAPGVGIDPAPIAIAALRNDLIFGASMREGEPSTRALLEAAASGSIDLPDPGGLSDEEKAALKARAADLRSVADALDALTD